MKIILTVVLACYIALFVGLAASMIGKVNCDGVVYGIDVVGLIFLMTGFPAALGYFLGKSK